MSNYEKIIQEICKENDIECTFISKGWIAILKKNNIRKIILGYKFGINNYTIGSLCDDKYATYDFLKTVNIPMVTEKIFYSPQNTNDYAIDSNSYDKLLNFYNQCGKDVVLKQINGTCGKNIYHIKDEKSLKLTYEKMTTKFFSICAGPYYEIENEYRVIMLDGQTKLTYKKIKPVVIGNGKDNLKDLLIDFNPSYFMDKDIEDNHILENGEVYEYDWRFNLCNGAKASFEIDETTRIKIENMARRATKELGIRFCSVDIIKTNKSEYYIMEINSGVMMENFIEQFKNGYSIAKQIYADVIIKMFQQN